ncbi:MAG: DUF58 domain-containing protein [Verrucomicrobiaceae bacterium]|nr:DUF58 domain-containing protein [Verrucomicrobiaceae bacterium]
MFVPSTRLIWLAGIVGIPLMFGLGFSGLDGMTLALAGAVVLLILMVDGMRSLSLLSQVSVELPETVHTTKSKTFNLEAIVSGLNNKTSCLRLGLPFPRALEAAEEIVQMSAVKKPNSGRASWKVTSLDRGHHEFDVVYAEVRSYWHLWDIRRAIPVKCEVRVYPDLSREKHVLAPLFFRRGAMGTHQVRQLGKGREFEQLRAYLPGDSYDDVYWKGTAKRRFPVTMMYQVEKTQELHVIVDISRRSGRPLEASSRGVDAAYERFLPRTQCERFIQAALVLALAAEQQSDRFGLTVFSDQVHTLLPAGSGKAHYTACRDTLYSLEPRPVSPDFNELFIHIGNRLRHRALIVVLTDLGEPWLSESFASAIGNTARRHVMLVHTLGSREFQPLFASNSTIQHADDLYAKIAGHLMWSDLQGTSHQLKQAGVHLTSSVQESLIADVVTSYLNTKRRQLV